MSKAENEDAVLEAFGKRKRGQIPYGFSNKDGLLVENDREQKILANMQLWREKEGLSYDAIADRLNRMLIESRKNTRWYGAVVNEILARQKLLEAFSDEE